MKSSPENPSGVRSQESIVSHLVSLLGEDVILLWVTKAEKGPRWKGWKNTGIEMMSNRRYLKNLDSGHNLAVLTGAPSGGLCSIDIDDDEPVELEHERDGDGGGDLDRPARGQ